MIDFKKKKTIFVVRDEALYFFEALVLSLPRKRCRGDEPLATLCQIGPARESNPRSPTPIIMRSTNELTDRCSYGNYSVPHIFFTLAFVQALLLL